MKAVQLNGFAGLESLKLVEIDRPTSSKNEVLYTFSVVVMDLGRMSYWS